LSARVLVVDDILPNVKLLEAKLLSEYFDVMTATSGPDALEMVHREKPDIVLLDVMMPGMDGHEVCKLIKSNPETSHIPVVMVTALDKQEDRVRGLESGADDFLSKPVQDLALFARVRSLARLKVTIDEYRNRESTEITMGSRQGVRDLEIDPENTQIFLVNDDEKEAKHLAQQLSSLGKMTCVNGEGNVADQVREKDYDLVIISLVMPGRDGLRICSQLRSYEETRNVPILVIVGENDSDLLVKALDMGVNDYLMDPPDDMELVARVKTQLKRKQFADELRENLHKSMKLATTDAVTGLYNRHYMSSHLDTLSKAAAISGKEISFAMLDIDHFKKVNDTHGHAAGDEVLQEFSQRIARNIRGVDLAARYGGEEFCLAMPDTRAEDAWFIAERLRKAIQDEPFVVSSCEEPINITVSIGLMSMVGDHVSSKLLLEQADEALYKAKDSGRNQVVVAN